MISKMILASNDYGCSEEAISIAAVLSIQVAYLLHKFKPFCVHCMDVWSSIQLLIIRFMVVRCTDYFLSSYFRISLDISFHSLQSIWFSGRGSQKELDEAKLRFAAAEVFYSYSQTPLVIYLYTRDVSSLCNFLSVRRVTILPS